MFGFGNKKEKLETKYRKLLDESRRLSTVNRQKGDEKLAEAELVLKQIEELERQN